MNEKVPQGARPIHFCAQCTRRIKPTDQERKAGDGFLCGGCAAALPPRSSSKGNLTPASAALSDAQTSVPDPGALLDTTRSKVMLAVGVGVLLVCGLALWVLL